MRHKKEEAFMRKLITAAAVLLFLSSLIVFDVTAQEGGGLRARIEYHKAQIRKHRQALKDTEGVQAATRAVMQMKGMLTPAVMPMKGMLMPAVTPMKGILIPAVMPTKGMPLTAGMVYPAKRILKEPFRVKTEDARL